MPCVGHGALDCASCGNTPRSQGAVFLLALGLCFRVRLCAFLLKFLGYDIQALAAFLKIVALCFEFLDFVTNQFRKLFVAHANINPQNPPQVNK